MRTTSKADAAINRTLVESYLHALSGVAWSLEGKVTALVETPQPHRHAVRTKVRVVAGKGFAGDHPRKSYYRGGYVPGREVSAIASEVLRVLGVDPDVVGDNLITEGVDLAALDEGDWLQVGAVVLRRSNRAHLPCRPFRDRTSPEAFAVVSRNGYRGALFVVERGGIIRSGDPVKVRYR